MEYDEEFQTAVTSFGVDFYGKVTKNATAGSANFIFSPMSIYSAMLLLTAGADGGTLEELLEVLQIPEHLRTDHLHKAFGPIMKRYFTGSSEMDLNVANRLFLLMPTDILPSYEKEVESCYMCSVEQLTSLGDLEAMRVHMNKWVATNTRNKIRQLFSPNALSGSELLVLVNALYFRGTWVQQFNKSLTREKEFHCLDECSMVVQMMQIESDFEVAELDELNSVAVKLPFRKEDSQFSWDMLVLVPNEITGLPKVLSQLQIPGKLQSVISGTFMPQHTFLMLPKFKMSEGESLDVRAVLEQCGVRQLFSGSANLSKMSSGHLNVSKATHKAVIEVDEEGVTAAAVTAFSIDACLESCFEIFVNRPFFVALLCNSNLPVFMGHIIKPQWH